jgi:hypothetical protein
MWRLEWADSMPPLALRSLLVQPISSKIRICRPILAAVSDEKSTTRGGDTVLNQLPASTPDGITTKLIDAISCLSNVSDLLLKGADIFDSYVRHWLVSVSDDLIGLALDIRPGEVRYELLLMLAAIGGNSPDAATPLDQEARYVQVNHFRFARDSPAAMSHFSKTLRKADS